jgi:protein-disulfide isomerase
MQDPAIAAAIGRNLALARDLRITGIPSFVAGDEIVRGLVDFTAMQGLISATRKPSEG